MSGFFQIILIYAVVGLVIGAFSAFIAGEKNRDTFYWFLLGFLFNIISLLALMAVPPLKESIRKPKSQTLPQSKRVGNYKAENVMRLLLFVLGIMLIILIGYFNFS
ncbi:hypothetical protein BMS3Abin04_02670 [bacterium BMS3Abin04]|nr:hypothetical protein BMS3Abin04_02670 [bacterium BMS3Abin04]